MIERCLPEGRSLFISCSTAPGAQSKKQTIEYELAIQPFAWLRIHGVTNPKQIEAIRQRIIIAVYEEEDALAKERQEGGLSVIGAENLRGRSTLASSPVGYQFNYSLNLRLIFLLLAYRLSCNAGPKQDRC